jgi:serine/threonine-protein kinase
MAICPQCRRRYSDADEYCEADGSTLVPDATFLSVDRDLLPGEIVGEYRVERLIGKGSFGVVYRAVHPVIGKAAAVKILKREFSADPDMVSRFISEARAVNQIRHRNIVDIFSFGAFRDGRQYYVMELLEGQPLDQYLAANAPLSPADALPILDRISRALDAAHGAGIVHRDLKPANVFLATDDGVRFPKLLDFGVAKLTREDERYAGYRTHTGAMLGTPHYMSPEQCRGEAVDCRTDIYAFGVMVQEMLTGHLPFEGDSLLKIMTMHTSTPPPKMSEKNPVLPFELDAPVLRMLEKEPARRPLSVGQAYRELSDAARVAGHAVPSTPSPSIRGTPAPDPSRRAFDSSRARSARAAGTLGPQTVSERPQRRLVAYTTLVTTGVVAVLAIAFVLSRYRTGPAPTPAPTIAGPPGQASESGERGARTAPSVAPPAGADSVRFSVQSVPPTAEAFIDGRSLGTAPGPLVVPRGDKPVTLQFKASGYHSKNVEVTPSGDGVVSVTLSPASGPSKLTPRPKRPVDDLEF